MELPRHRRHSREVRNAQCDTRGCLNMGVTYKCGKCSTRLYCSIDCQRLDWDQHSCTGYNPLPSTGVSALLGWLGANVRVRKRSRDPTAVTPLHQCGYLGHGSDGHVIGVVIDGQALALKLGVFDPLGAHTEHMMIEAEIQHRLFRGTHAVSANGPSLSAAVVALHTYWQAHVSVRELVLAMHPGAPVPNHDELRLVGLLASERHVEVNEPRLVVGMLMELMPLSLSSLWQAGSTTADQFNNLYAQLVGCLGVLQPSGLTHTDLHGENVRLIGCSARRIVYHIGDRFYELPLLASIHPGAGINGTRAVIADCGRATVDRPNISLSRRLPWHVNDPSLLHWPNVANPGYDLWMLAVDAVLESLPGCLPPPIVRHMIPSMEQLRALHEYCPDRSAHKALDLAAHAAHAWFNIDLWDMLRQHISSEMAHLCYDWCAPWPPRFYRTPLQVLDNFGVPYTCHRPSAACEDITLVEWNEE